jgi:hypothetical protein
MPGFSDEPKGREKDSGGEGGFNLADLVKVQTENGFTVNGVLSELFLSLCTISSISADNGITGIT